jgi:hypothetical protein
MPAIFSLFSLFFSLLSLFYFYQIKKYFKVFELKSIIKKKMKEYGINNFSAAFFCKKPQVSSFSSC